MTRGTGAAELSRATFEAVAHQVADVLDSMRQFRSRPSSSLRVDGGAIRSDLLATLVADMCGIPIVRCDEPNVAALGAALLAGVGRRTVGRSRVDRRRLAITRRSLDPTFIRSAQSAKADQRWAEAV